MSAPGEDDATRFRLLRGGPPPAEATTPRPLAYTNRHHVTLYLHEMRDKLGRFQYVARRSVQEGALTSMPLGFDFVEHLSGRVSLRRIRGGRYLVPFADLQRVRTALARFPELHEHIATRACDSITIHEPAPQSDFVFTLAGEEPPAFTFRGPEFMRPAMIFEVVRDGPAATAGLYDVLAPANEMDLRWTRFERGRIVDLAVRHLSRLRVQAQR